MADKLDAILDFVLKPLESIFNSFFVPQNMFRLFNLIMICACQEAEL